MASSPRSSGRSLASLAAEHGTGLFMSLIFIAPIGWALLSTFKPTIEARQPPIPPWPTTGFSVQNYVALNSFGEGVWHYGQNSIFVAVASVILTSIISLFAGYGFARFRFPLKNLFFILILSTIMIPFQSILTPIFLILTWLGLQNTLTGLVLVYVTLQMPFSIFMMRNAFEAIPKELDEAAQIDGCNSFTLLLRVLLPAVKPGLITVGLFAFLAAWNDFLAPLILLNDSSKSTLPLAVANLRGQVQGVVDYGATEAGVVVLALPCVLLFLILQRHYVRGFLSGAFKG
jgi:multiple sugar transport system permease protein